MPTTESSSHRSQPCFQPARRAHVTDAVIASQSTNSYVNAVLVRPSGHSPDEVAESIRRWKRLTVYTRAQMEEILVGKLIAMLSRQFGMFLVP